jgi:hypothetical protein
MISTHHRRHSAWTDERKLKLEQLARATGRLLDDLLPSAGRVQSIALPAPAEG